MINMEDLGPYHVLIESQLRNWEWDPIQIERQIRAERRSRPFAFRQSALMYNAYRSEAVDFAILGGSTPKLAVKAFDAAVHADPQRVVDDFEGWKVRHDETLPGVVSLSQTVTIEYI